jgi:hypothetical protein
MPPGKSKKGGKNARRGKRDEQVSLYLNKYTNIQIDPYLAQRRHSRSTPCAGIGSRAETRSDTKQYPSTRKYTS